MPPTLYNAKVIRHIYAYGKTKIGHTVTLWPDNNLFKDVFHNYHTKEDIQSQMQQEEKEGFTQDEVEAIKQYKNLFRRVVQMLSEHLAHTARNMIRTDQVENSDIVRKYDAETKDGTLMCISLTSQRLNPSPYKQLAEWPA
ncbi:hypothetical protein AARAC_000963 [Aspergillus arachidicola]|uniref:Uncharacterized protein n=1 Tax=Aspergillus arachidicola TaxID=656916 RepID=A0A2G7G6Q3_9EURO|nr:hypothetical protein AARAC_000963 [Aspergillus arachidicola]